MDRFRVVICGGGIAAVEGLLRLRTLAGDALDITLLAPNDELRYRPLAVDEPFAKRGVRRYPLRTIARRTGAEWLQDAAEWVDPQAQMVHTDDGEELPYDALLIAVGGRLVMPFDHVTVFDDAHADEGYHGLIQDVEGGYTRSVALIVPEGHAWLLPAYELALMTAERAASMGEEGLGISIVTPEPAPLAALGEAASSAVGELLERARVRVYPNARPTVPAAQHVLVGPDGPGARGGPHRGAAAHRGAPAAQRADRRAGLRAGRRVRPGAGHGRARLRRRRRHQPAAQARRPGGPAGRRGRRRHRGDGRRGRDARAAAARSSAACSTRAPSRSTSRLASRTAASSPR